MAFNEGLTAHIYIYIYILICSQAHVCSDEGWVFFIIIYKYIIYVYHQIWILQTYNVNKIDSSALNKTCLVILPQIFKLITKLY